ncbi:uncharacterized protein LOC132605993 [Lycium barbarum]|uniref:uncharacterized protein LOC132605993 n=1 Tax=Lycium barbarum TaxID=112863 RepID=UPI00293EE146|nr:uncharacterized protein LOC132605993 [Lycium barbarum]
MPAEVVTRLLNVLEALAPNNGGIPGPQATSQAQAQVQLNVAANQTPQLAPQQFVQSAGQSKEFKNFMGLKPPEVDASPTSIDPQKFIDRCEKILTTLGLKETRGVEFATFLFSGSAESWWISIQRGRQAGLPPITWSELLALFKDRFIPLSKQDDMRRQFNNLRQGTMTVTEYEAKFIDLSRYVPYLVEDPREKVRRFVDGLEHRYRGPVVRDVRYGTYSDVVDTALRYESYLEMDKVERERKKPRNTCGFSGVPSGGKSGFYRGQSRSTQSESVVQSSGGYSARQGQQQMQRKGNSSYQSGYHPRCSNCGRNHSGRCFGADGACFTCRERGHIAKYCPKGNSGASRATTQPQGTTTAT